MNTRRAAAIVAAFAASLLPAAEPAIEFTGVLSANGQTRVALTDPRTRATTWVPTGQLFNGYTVARYDAKEDAVFLKKSGQETRLPLVSGRKVEEKRAVSAADNAVAAAVTANLRLLAMTARQYQQGRGATNVGYSDLVGPDKPIKELKPVAGENYSTLSFGPTVTRVNVTTTNGTTVSLDLPPAGPTESVPVLMAETPATPPNGSPPTPAAPGAATPPAPSATTAEVVTPTGPPSTPPPANPSPVHVTQEGDTLQKISTRSGVPLLQLKQLNPAIQGEAPIPPGQGIRLR